MVLKTQSIVRHHQRWLTQNRTKEFVRDCSAIAWTPTLRIIHNNNAPKTSFTSVQDCALRAHRIKKMHGMLPTLQQMRLRRPDLYQTDVCVRCDSEETETDHHLWNCAATMDDQAKAWDDIMWRVNVTGRRALKHALKLWEKDREKAEGMKKEFKRPPPTFTVVDVDVVWTSLSWINGALKRSGRLMDTHADVEDEVVLLIEWTVKDIYHLSKDGNDV
ncbi:hypothetical protein BGZ76_004252 [Entomortierella beljakovae]|nr:hypothetical protein BGZ76_004252 [Entomortierella beljakovae]